MDILLQMDELLFLVIFQKLMGHEQILQCAEVSLLDTMRPLVISSKKNENNTNSTME